MLHLIKQKCFLLSPTLMTTLKIPLMLPYREAYYKHSLFEKAKFMGKLVLNDK